MERARPTLPHESLPLPFPRTASLPDTHFQSSHFNNKQPAAEKSGIIYDAREAKRSIEWEELTERLRKPYDQDLEALGHLRTTLGAPENRAQNQTTEENNSVEVAEVRYETGIGTLNFEELSERTRKYAAFVLYHTHQVQPVDLDDGLQAGYAHLWERLQREPESLKDKPMAWIGKGIVFKALHAIRHDWMYQKHTQATEGRSSTDRRGTQSPESRQTDMRIDIHQAIAQVAQHILTHEKGKQAEHDLWALYGLTMLHVSSSELSRLFHVREQSIHAAYNRVREKLKTALPHYAPFGETKPVGKRGPEALPQQDMTVIHQANALATEDVYKAVQAQIESLNADTRPQDELALEGIQQGIQISTQARKYGLPQYRMQRAYKRVHLMIAAEGDPTVRTLRSERRMKHVFTLTTESAVAVEQLALDLLKQSKSYEKLVALHAHISNLAISTTAKHFNIPTSTLRYYSQQIGKQLQTPTEPARKEKPRQYKQDELSQLEVTVYARESAAD